MYVGGQSRPAYRGTAQDLARALHGLSPCDRARKVFGKRATFLCPAVLGNASLYPCSYWESYQIEDDVQFIPRSIESIGKNLVLYRSHNPEYGIDAIGQIHPTCI